MCSTKCPEILSTGQRRNWNFIILHGLSTFGIISTAMKLLFAYLPVFLVVTMVSCRTSSGAGSRDNGKIDIDLIQINDVYEIAPLAGGSIGGLARVATLKKQVIQANPNALMVISGDFLSPSVFNSLRNGDKPIRGAQMVDALNAAGLDIAVFGNHEFDLSEADLQQRIDESSFQWVASNVMHKSNRLVVPFARTGHLPTDTFPKYYFKTFKDADGTSVRIGFFGLTIPSNLVAFVQYRDPLQSAIEVYDLIRDSCDAVVAITHLPLEEDIRLAKRLPKLAVILGGHEHDMHLAKTGNVYVSKAHANAKSAYVVRLQINKRKRTVRAFPVLKMLDDKMAIDSATNVVVKQWMDIGDKNYASLGFDARQVLITKGDTLNGLEKAVRFGKTNLTVLIGEAIAAAHPQAEAVIYNAGSIRLDDVLLPPVTQYDIIRTLPFGGTVVDVDLSGALLKQVLDAGQKNKGSGGYLQYQSIFYTARDKSYLVRGQALDTARTYRVAINEFLLLGLEKNLAFLTPGNPGISRTYGVDNANPADMRLAVVRYLQNINSR